MIEPADYVVQNHPGRKTSHVTIEKAPNQKSLTTSFFPHVTRTTMSPPIYIWRPRFKQATTKTGTWRRRRQKWDGLVMLKHQNRRFYKKKPQHHSILLRLQLRKQRIFTCSIRLVGGPRTGSLFGETLRLLQVCHHLEYIVSLNTSLIWQLSISSISRCSMKDALLSTSFLSSFECRPNRKIDLSKCGLSPSITFCSILAGHSFLISK